MLNIMAAGDICNKQGHKLERKSNYQHVCRSKWFNVLGFSNKKIHLLQMFFLNVMASPLHRVHLNQLSCNKCCRAVFTYQVNYLFMCKYVWKLLCPLHFPISVVQAFEPLTLWSRGQICSHLFTLLHKCLNSALMLVPPCPVKEIRFRLDPCNLNKSHNWGHHKRVFLVILFIQSRRT